jgi:hypothetical protein
VTLGRTTLRKLLTLPGDVTVTVHFGLPAEVPLLVTLKPIFMVDELRARIPMFVAEYEGPPVRAPMTARMTKRATTPNKRFLRR